MIYKWSRSIYTRTVTRFLLDCSFGRDHRCAPLQGLDRCVMAPVACPNFVIGQSAYMVGRLLGCKTIEEFEIEMYNQKVAV